VDNHYKHGLLRPMLDRAYRLSSSWEYFSDECGRLQNLFSCLKYPEKLISQTINRFVTDRTSPKQPIPTAKDPNTTVRIVLPYKDQCAADVVRNQLKDLGHKINIPIQPEFVSRKIQDELKYEELKPPIVTQQRVVYEFKCGSCDANYVGYTTRCQHERCEEHNNPTSSIGKHCRNEHGFVPKDLSAHFSILKKCKSKFVFFLMLFIRGKTPSLNVQSDSFRAKLFK